MDIITTAEYMQLLRMRIDESKNDVIEKVCRALERTI